MVKPGPCPVLSLEADRVVETTNSSPLPSCRTRRCTNRARGDDKKSSNQERYSALMTAATTTMATPANATTTTTMTTTTYNDGGHDYDCDYDNDYV